MQTLFQDLRFGARQLLKRPGFTLLAIISMALGIGANTAIFSLVDTVAFRPLPVRNASELQELYATLHNGSDYTLQSYLNYKDYRDRNQVFSGLVAYRLVVASLSHNGTNERLWGMTVPETTSTSSASRWFSDVAFFRKKIRLRNPIRSLS